MGKAQKRAAAQRKAAARKGRGGKASNAFDVLGNARQRFPVLNRRVKGENRNVARARAEAVERRKETLLQEYQASKRSNAFRDRRFGEGDAGLSVEDKMMERFRRERSKRARKSDKYRLPDEVDGGANNGLTLTHGGRALGEEDYTAAPEDRLDSDEEVGGGRLDSVAHFGAGGGEGDGPKKSHRDIVEEVIARSKEQKLARLLEKEKREATAEKLDAGYADLVQFLDFRPTRRDPEYVIPPADDYDILQRQMLLETKKAKPTDRTKTPEELAKEEAEKLAELEKERLERAQGVPGAAPEAATRTDDDLAEDAMGEAAEKYVNPHVFQFQQFVEDAEDAADAKDALASDESADDGDTAEEGAGSDAEASDADTSDEEALDLDETETAGLNLGVAKTTDPPASMPFTPGCPRSMDELNELIGEHARSVEDVDTLLRRILATHSLKLPQHRGVAEGAGDARARMHEFYSLLLRRFEALGDACAGAPLPGAARGLQRAALQRQVASVAQHLHGVTEDLTGVAAARWVARLLRAQRRLEKLLGDVRDGLHVATCWPSAGKLLLLQLAARVWPTSDRRHPVTTPASIFLGQCLAETPVGPSHGGISLIPDPGATPSPDACVRVTREAFRAHIEWDVTAGAFCAGICVDWGHKAKRFHPEALTYLRGLLAHFGAAADEASGPQTKVAALATAAVAGVLDLEEDAVSAGDRRAAAMQLVAAARQRLGIIASPPLRTLGLFWLRHAAAAWEPDAAVDMPVPRLRLASQPSEEWTAKDRCDMAAALLAATYRSVLRCVPTLAACVAAPELLAPFNAALASVRPQASPALSAPLLALHVGAHEAVRSALLAAKAQRARAPPLRWQRAPKAMVQSVAPRLDAGDRVTLRRDKTVSDREEVERRQLKRQIARERRGAKRELRRDADFLALERQQEAADRRAETKAEVRKNMAWLQEQQAVVNEQVKKGGSLLKGGGSGVKKKPRIK